MTYDPAFMNTASCRSAITYIDGDRGILRYRGYPIEQLAEHSNYLEVAYLLLNGELPDADAAARRGRHEITVHTLVHENIKKFMDGFHYDAHPMGMLISTVGALSTFYPDAQERRRPRDPPPADPAPDRQDAHARGLRLPATAWACPTSCPDNELCYTGNFLNMLFRMAEPKYQPNPVLERALDMLFILHADHEQNCSTNTMRGMGSSQADPYSALAGAAAALYGPLHGGANEEVLRMLQEIGSVDNVPASSRT